LFALKRPLFCVSGSFKQRNERLLLKNGTQI
jgi:hypothetical protein